MQAWAALHQKTPSVVHRGPWTVSLASRQRHKGPRLLHLHQNWCRFLHYTVPRSPVCIWFCTGYLQPSGCHEPWSVLCGARPHPKDTSWVLAPRLASGFYRVEPLPEMSEPPFFLLGLCFLRIWLQEAETSQIRTVLQFQLWCSDLFPKDSWSPCLSSSSQISFPQVRIQCPHGLLQEYELFQ